MRTDLLALTDDSLVSLANRGILKRAVKENAAAPPDLTEAEDGTVEVVFADGIRTTLPPGVILEKSPCTCAAAAICRHRVMAVLAYRALRESAGAAVEPTAAPTGSATGTEGSVAADAATDSAGHPAAPTTSNSDAIGGGSESHGDSEGSGKAGNGGETRSADGVPAALSHQAPWSPAEFSDEQLRDLLGARAISAARRARRTGYRAKVRRATGRDPVPSVELSAVTVRFLVPKELEYARADAARGARTDAIALAVWAFRVADELEPEAAELEVTVGDAADGSAAVTAAASVHHPLTDLLKDGVAHGGPTLPEIFTATHRALDAAGARWPHDALTDLLDQLAAYRDRSARHDPLHTAALITELVARHRASARDWVPVLGTEEAASTPLKHLRLTGLGARIHGDDESRTVEVFLAHPDARIVLTLRHTTAVPEDIEAPTAAALGARRTSGARLADLAAGNVVTESAVRSANRTVRLANSRVAKTSVLPSSGDWEKLPTELLVTDLDAEAARLAALPPSFIRPRVHGESLRAVAVTSVDEIRYLPGEQRLEATLRASTGTATITYTHTPHAPGALDALTQALSGDSGPVRYIAGALERHHGRLTLTPTAVVTDATVVVPCFAATDIPASSGTIAPASNPLTTALNEALALSSEVPHRGTRHLPPTWSTRAKESAATLRRLGLVAAATALESLGDAPALDRWVDAHLRLLVTAEQL
ncbi:hypothetical protein [Nocardia sp. NPDC050406]|uniref:hypothetical protein n=1 Tax=Nocardia sp. NPDC050406 TaxID=3364318 RepID=UPI0037B6EAAE